MMVIWLDWRLSSGQGSEVEDAQSSAQGAPLQIFLQELRRHAGHVTHQFPLLRFHPFDLVLACSTTMPNF